jgi:FixJ family two-component response regulator
VQAQVFFLDDNAELLELLIEFVGSAVRAKCYGYTTFADFEQNLNAVLQSRVVVLDVELGSHQASGIDAYHLLKENSFEGQVFFLTGHGHSHPLVQEAMKSGSVVWEKPVNGDKIVSALQAALETSAQFEDNSI